MQNQPVHSVNEKDSRKRHWSETALDWFQREQLITRGTNPTDPKFAACSFARGNTGILFFDEAIKKGSKLPKHAKSENRPAFLELIGDKPGSALALTSLAARFVVATRSSKFRSAPFQPEVSLPQVVLIDSLHSFSTPKLVSTIRSNLLLDMANVQDEAIIQQEVEECLKRIHFIFVNDLTTTVASLEALRMKLRMMDLTMHMVLWDGFLSVIPDANSKMEAIRQLVRLWHGTNALVVVASHRKNLMLDKYATCQISFEPKEEEPNLYLAKVCGTEFVAKVGMTGILS
mmetsp:Transcript_1896/g.2913  ORF Transcript_1896/g.2913 Transcript_1896/m.2913 type:complete len:288 (-) Transcript_1896:315-1178(-)